MTPKADVIYQHRDIIMILVRKCSNSIKKYWLNPLLSTLAILSIWGVLAIQLEIIHLIDVELSDKMCKSINHVYLNLSYSYIAALIFYILTIVIPKWKGEKTIQPVLILKTVGIRRVISDILLEFSRETEYDPNNLDVGNCKKILLSKDWNKSMIYSKQLYGHEMRYTEYTHVILGELNKQLTDFILTYMKYLTEEQLVLIEDIKASPIHKFLSMGGIMRFEDGTFEIPTECFCGLIRKFKELEESFK